MLPEGPLSIQPLAQPISWDWPIPGSKSLTNRALPLAAMAAGNSTLHGVLHSDDTRHMINALRQWGIEVTVNGNTIEVLVRPVIRPLQRVLNHYLRPVTTCFKRHGRLLQGSSMLAEMNMA